MPDWSFARTAATFILLAILGVATWRDRSFLPLLAFVAWMILVDYLRVPLDAAYDRADSWQRLWLHIDQALYLSVTFGFVGACAVLFEARGGLLAAVGAWLLSLLALVWVRSAQPDASAVVYTVASVVALLAGWGLVVRAVFGSVVPTWAHLAAMVLIAGDTVSRLYGFIDLAPEGLAAFAASWDAIRAVNVFSLGLGAIIAALSLVRR